MTNLNNKAALLQNNQVIGEVFDAPAKGDTIEVAGCFTESGQAVNVQTYKISRSKINLQAASKKAPVYKNGNYWEFDLDEVSRGW